MALAEVMNSTQSGLIAVDDKMNVILLTPAGKSLLGVMGAYRSRCPSARSARTSTSSRSCARP